MKVVLLGVLVLLTGCANLHKMLNPRTTALRERERIEAEEDAAYLAELESVKAEYPNYNWDKPNSDGKTFEYLVLDYANRHRIKTFREAFLKFKSQVEENTKRYKAFQANPTMENFEAYLTPDSRGITQNVEVPYYLWYDGDEPFFVYFDKNKKYVMTGKDTATIENRIRLREDRIRDQRMQKQLADVERAQAWQSLGNSLQMMNMQNQINNKVDRPAPSYQIPMRK